MNAEQKFRLARIIILAMAVAFTTIVIAWLVVIHNPSSLDVAVDFKNASIEVNCDFTDQE